MSGKLSIIVPVYNVEKYMDQCVASIVNQDYRDFTLILVDDGSTDSSGRKCDQWAKADGRIQVYHKPNGGLMSAWKYGLMRAATEYIGFVDSDDWIDADMFSKLLQKAEETDSDMVVCGWVSEYEDGRENKRETVKLAGKTFDADGIRRQVYPILISGGDYRWMGISPNRWTKLYKRDTLLKNIAFCDDRVSIGEDFLSTFSTIPNVRRITVLQDCFPYHYRIHNESMIHKYSDSTYEKIEVLYECLMRVNHTLDYDFTVQINTYHIKLMMAQLDNEMLFSGKRYPEIRKRMRELWGNERLQAALAKSEVSKLPGKYRFYIKCLRFHLYEMLFLIRKAKKV